MAEQATLGNIEEAYSIETGNMKKNERSSHCHPRGHRQQVTATQATSNCIPRVANGPMSRQEMVAGVGGFRDDRIVLTGYMRRGELSRGLE